MTAEESLTALEAFMDEIEVMKDVQELTQKDIAEKMGTSQSAVSRIATMKTNPTYKQLLKMTEAVNGKLLITPRGDMVYKIPFDLQDSVREIAAIEKLSLSEYIEKTIRCTIELDRGILLRRPFRLLKVKEDENK